MRYITLYRTSKDKQTTENQVLECRSYIHSRIQPGDEIYEFDEPDVSTRIPMEKRQKLQEMLSFVRKGDTLVLFSVDRLARNGVELVTIYCKKLIEKGINVVSLSQPYIDHITIHIYALIALSERENTRNRTISGLNRKKHNLEKVGNAWFGFKCDPNQLQLNQKDAKSYGKPFKLIPEDTEAQAVKLMIERWEEGDSLAEITRAVEAAGFRNRRGNAIHKMTISRILKRLDKQNPALPALELLLSH